MKPCCPLTAAAIAIAGLSAMAMAEPPSARPEAASALVQKIRGELSGPPTDDSRPRPGVPHGETLEGVIGDSAIYPGTENAFTVYVPAQYNPARPACLLVCLDRIGETGPTVFDNLIAAGEMPVTVAVGLSAGTVWKTKGKEAYRWNRSYEFDSTNGRFPSFVIEELLPRIEALKTKDGRPIRLSHEAGDRAAMGGSTGGIGSFTLAWERPDSFSRVYSMIGTFVSMRGGHDYPALIRKTEPKPIRVFLEDGSTDAWNPLFGSWFMANEDMEAALAFAGYDVEHAWGEHGHTGAPGAVILPDVMRWLWRGWPAAVSPGHSANDMLASILIPGEAWQPVAGDYGAAAGLASNAQGEVYFCDPTTHTILRLGADGAPRPFSWDAPREAGQAFGPDGTLYATVPGRKKIIAFDAQGTARDVAANIRASRILVTARDEIYATEPGTHADEPSTIWLIKPDGERKAVDQGLLSASGIAFSPDGNLLLAAEHATSRVSSFVVGADGSLNDREPFFWLHAADSPGESGTADLAVDLKGSLYAATRQGVQVCDRNGRVRAILWLPSPSGPVQGLCWGGAAFDTLYATDGRTLFKRRLRIPGYSQWAAPVPIKDGNAG